MREYYRNFLSADLGFYRVVWTLRHLLDNSRYYFHGFYADYYRHLFRAIRNRLITMTEQHAMHVLVVRLASTWSGSATPALDRMARTIFAAPASKAAYSFIDLEQCVRSNTELLGINYDDEFRWHPGPIGHQIYANCLVDTVHRIITTSPRKAAH